MVFKQSKTSWSLDLVDTVCSSLPYELSPTSPAPPTTVGWAVSRCGAGGGRGEAVHSEPPGAEWRPSLWTAAPWVSHSLVACGSHAGGEHFCMGSRAHSVLVCECCLLLNFSGQLPLSPGPERQARIQFFLKGFFFNMDHFFFKFYSICYNIASVLGFVFLARRHVSS